MSARREVVPLLAVRGLEREGTGAPDFDLAAGEALAVMGPSGSGKSLFLRALADLDPAGGEIALRGEDRGAMSGPDWRKRVTYVAAESGWWVERVAEHFEDWQAAAPLVRRLGLPEEAGQWRIARLSTGERQRLALVRALVQEPAVLLLDEPTSGLDPDATKAVEALLRERLAAGTALLFSTHDEEQARRLAKRVIRFRAGQSAEESLCR